MYQVIATNLSKVEEALHKEWDTDVGYSIMRNLVGTENDPPKSCYGDAFVIRDALINHGCVFSVDFYIKRLKE